MVTASGKWHHSIATPKATAAMDPLILLFVLLIVSIAQFSALDQGQDEVQKDATPVLPGATEGNKKTPAKKVELGGKAVPFDELGPIVVNKDGTSRRISNWNDMSQEEQVPKR